MKVISLVGPSGAGKTTVLEKLKSNYTTNKEMYMELNRHGLDNRLLVSKWLYIGNWFDQILEHFHSGEELVVTDRSPLDTCAYVSKDATVLLELVLSSFNELSNLGIEFKTILVTGDFGTLQERINARLKSEPARLQYNEADTTHNKKAHDFYVNNNHNLFTAMIDSTKTTPEEQAGEIDKLILKLCGNI
jgi:thymidylate kinase